MFTSSFQENQAQTQKIMSLYDYKIDFNHPLGSGNSGIVYQVLKRPENEKGWFSFLCPCLYDYIYRTDRNNLKKKKFCVKILCFKAIFFETKKQISWNKKLRERGITNLEFVKSDSMFCFFKTEVQGNTLEYYSKFRNNFCKEEDFEPRKYFFDFLCSINENNLLFSDLHFKNIMYDVNKCSWEIIDLEGVHETDHNVDIDFNLRSIFSKKNEIFNFLIKKILKIAKENRLYSKEIDQNIINKINAKFTIHKNEQDFSNEEVFSIKRYRNKYPIYFYIRDNFTIIMATVVVIQILFFNIFVFDR